MRFLRAVELPMAHYEAELAVSYSYSWQPSHAQWVGLFIIIMSVADTYEKADQYCSLPDYREKCDR